MNIIEKEIKLFHKFSDHMNNDIFYTKNVHKLKKEIKISKIFPIYMKNLNEYEVDFVQKENFRKIFSIVSIFPSLKELVETDKYLMDDKYCSFYNYIYTIKSLYNKYLEENNNEFINNAIKNNDVKSFCAYLSFFKQDIVVIEVKNWKIIDNFLLQYYNCTKDQIENLGYRDFFIEQYLNLFSIINLDLTIYQGIRLIKNDEIFLNYAYINEEYDEMFYKMLKKPYIIDRFVRKKEQIIDLLFIISNLEKNRYLKERKGIVDFVTCLEFILITQNEMDTKDNKIQKQFINKVKKCCEYVGYKVSGEDLRDIYDYRSLIVHGNFKKINEKTQKIGKKRIYLNMHKNKFDNELSYDNSAKEYIIYCRVYEIFNIIFRLYCEKNELINRLKELKDLSEIKEMEFNK